MLKSSIFQFATLIVAFASVGAFAAATTSADAVAERLADHLSPHPRLLLAKGGEATINADSRTNPKLAKLRQMILDDAGLVLKMAPLKRVLTGKRLLAVSRDALHRIGTLSLAYRLTGDPTFAAAGRENLLTLCAFTDFHREHFLDTAEIAAAIAVGYDWLFDTLNADDRRLIRAAVVEKALTLDVSAEGWFHGKNNWTQVCHGGLAMAALAIAEDEPSLADKVVSAAVAAVPAAMQAYAPDGAYPEGPNYWAYGTDYNVMLIASLQTAVGDDFGLLHQPGFLQSADYHLNSISPCGDYFIYSDCPQRPNGLAPAAFFMAKQRQQPWLLLGEMRLLDEMASAPPDPKTVYGSNRNWLALALAGSLPTSADPPHTQFVAGGVTPAAMFRSGWGTDATFLGIKGGSPATSHAHMDSGIFEIDHGGTRWASDPGAQDYESLESKGIQIWNMAQDSQRWSVFRLGSLSHSILTVDGQGQNVSGRADWIRTGSNVATLDMSAVYSGQLSKATRGATLRLDGSIRIQDEITAPARGVAVRWAMFTPAKATLDGSTATLNRDGRSLQLRVISPASVTLKIVPTDPPPHDFDASNPNTQLVTFTINLSPGESQTLVVDFLPSDAVAQTPPVVPLANW